MLYDKDIREPLYEFLEGLYGKVRILEGKNIGGSRADVLMIVNKVNRDAILSGAREAMAEASSRTDGASSPKETVRLTEENIHCPDDLSVVFPLLDKLVRPGDVVLYENDLPDTFI